ncbi:MAG: outer membrane beta-barrel family protein [Muribaculaceae bacterium]|nr:outer membrane beta-barrel family protein [Muribaculaceae bacterium]
MKNSVFIVIMLPLAAYGYQAAAMDPDSVTELKEISVIASTQRAEPDGTVYVPTNSQRASASDGVTLLARMNIPQLNVNVSDGSVKSADNRTVGIFIDYNPATAEDLAGLNPSDVRRVECLAYPSDPRFMRAEYVVNFIMREYSYGGYTKLSAAQRFMTRTGDASVYSRLGRGRMSYDLMLSVDGDRNCHTGAETRETYKLSSGTVERHVESQGSRVRHHGVFAGLRAVLTGGERFTFRNLISIRRSRTPFSETTGSVSLTNPSIIQNYIENNSIGNLSGGWDGGFYIDYGKGWTMNATANFELRNNSSSYRYSTPDNEIDNNADEKGWFARGNVQLDKKFSGSLSLFANVLSGGGRTRINYSGSGAALNRFRQTFTGVCIGAALSREKVTGSADAGYAFESNCINGYQSRDRYPFAHANINYAPSRLHFFNAGFQYATFSPDAAMKNPNIIRQSEFMYVGGNPELRCSRHISSNVSYTWLPGNRWSLAAYGTFFRIADRQIAVYKPDGPGGAILKKYFNDGDYNHGQIGARLTGKFLGGCLAVSVSPRVLMYHTTGSNRVSYFPFLCSISADYYMGKFFFNAGWSSSSGYVDGETAFLRRMPSEYHIGASWHHKGWNISMSVANFFRSSWIVSRDELCSQWYDSRIVQTGATSHRRIKLSVTYTFKYGSKVEKTDELSSDSGFSSAILK